MMTLSKSLLPSIWSIVKTDLLARTPKLLIKFETNIFIFAIDRMVTKNFHTGRQTDRHTPKSILNLAVIKERHILWRNLNFRSGLLQTCGRHEYTKSFSCGYKKRRKPNSVKM